MPKKQKKSIAVIGLGYVGLPLAIAFARKFDVIGFDINADRIKKLKSFHDETGEISSDELQQTALKFSGDLNDIRDANFYIVTVPTPIDEAKRPDLKALKSASKTVGQCLKKGDIVVYESTVYPGVTEDECLPVLEKESGLKSPMDFQVGYSPERINPGDKEHTFTKIKKVVSGQTPESLSEIAADYSAVVEAGIHEASCIKAAEAAKVIENTQRDLNIALVNELSIIFNKLGLDTIEVLEAAGTKWNFLPFRPGLVGGHCIGVDPFYLTHKAETVGIHPQVILAGRRINDGMGKFIAEQTIKLLSHSNRCIKKARVGILGLTFKENCPDVRNTKVVDIVNELKDYHVDVLVHDSLANKEITKEEYGIDLVQWSELKKLDALILAVAHDEYKKKSIDDLLSTLTEPKIMIDVKGVLDRKILANKNVTLWRL
jgi:UDP-N-acetyl-D-galactosamine dehydrogenase